MIIDYIDELTKSISKLETGKYTEVERLKANKLLEWYSIDTSEKDIKSEVTV